MSIMNRSQHKNKETCLKMLRARMYEFEIQKREEKIKKEISTKTDIGWGHQHLDLMFYNLIN